MQLKNMLEGLKYTCSGNTDVEITDIIYDSRKVVKGCVFVCLCGSSVDSHDFAQQAADAGATAIVAQRPVTVQNAAVVMVENTRYAMAVLSAA